MLGCMCICLKMFLCCPPHNLNSPNRKHGQTETIKIASHSVLKRWLCFTSPRRGQIKWVFDKTPDLQQPPHQDLECTYASESPHREIHQLCSCFCKLPRVCLPENSLLQHLRGGKVHSKQSTETFPQDSAPPQRIHCSILSRPKARL